MNVGNTTQYSNPKAETTEFEDILVKKGVIPERAEVVVERAKKEIQKEWEQKVVNIEQTLDEKLQHKSLEELGEIEDEVDDEFIEKYRRQRINELKAQTEKEIFGAVYPIQRSDFVREVTEASKNLWVIVELFKSGIEESTKMSELLRGLAQRQKATKFVSIQSTECVENWPDEKVPCIFLYHEGQLQTQIIGIEPFGGREGATVEKLEWVLASKGVFEGKISENPFEKKFTVKRNFIVQKEEDDEEGDLDDDW